MIRNISAWLRPGATGLTIVLLLLSAHSFAAPQPTSTGGGTALSDETALSESAAANTDKDVPEVTDDVPEAEAKPTETLGGSGLKNRKLSDIFEQFVPSETISADNAVPFPVDI